MLVDEAHRVAQSANDQSDGKYQVEVEHDGEGNVHSPLGQALSLIYCAKVTVFFIDDKQATETSEIGLSANIKRIAENYKEEIKKDIESFKKEHQKREKTYPTTRSELDREWKDLDANRFQMSSEEYEKANNKWHKKNNKLEREIKWVDGLQNVKSHTDQVYYEEQVLEAQFRCIGGDKFVAWIDEVLYKKPQDIRIRLNRDDFDFKIFNNPLNLYNFIKSKDNPCGRPKARLVAGWCWEWSDKTMGNGDLRKEVDLKDYGFNFAMPWETKAKPKGSFKSLYAPDTNSWASSPMGINQIGCVYTAQGFEFDYVGVILGPDIEYDQKNDCLKCLPSKNKKTRVSGKKGEELIRNIYRVLMSRGKSGCYIFCCDPNVAKYLQRFIINQ